MIKAKIIIMPKPEILDPQGKAVANSISSLGFSCSSVNVGKCIEINLKHNDLSKARVEIQEICEKLLTNNLIETFTFDITQI